VTLVERLRRSGLRVDVRALFCDPDAGGVAASVGGEARQIEIPENGIPGIRSTEINPRKRWNL